MKTAHLAAAAALAVLAQGTFKAQAAILINTVTVGNINNVADPSTGSAYGSVGYSYNIGKYEVTIGQYTAFLNAVAATDTYSLYNTNMGTNLNVAGIARNGGNGSYTYSVMTNSGSSANRPITYVSWFDAARFANWMANGQPVGTQGNATTENGAYTLNGAVSGTNFVKNMINPITQGVVTWWIPSENEWYKAAYYSPGASADSYWLYPTQSDITPSNVAGSAGGANYFNGVYTVSQSSSFPTGNALTNAGSFNAASHYGTYDQGGNVYEWNDAVVSNSFSSSRVIRGGYWRYSNQDLLQASLRYYYDPVNEFDSIGFRLASVPEPSAAMLVLLSGAGWLVRKGRRILL